MVKNLPTSAGDARGMGSVPGWGRSPGGGNASILTREIPQTGACWTIVPEVTKSQM